MNDRNNHNLYKEVMLKLYHLVQTDGEVSRRLPTLRTLAEQFNCTHPTVLRAVRELVKQKVLIQLKNGDYRTIPQATRQNTRYLALIYRMSMDMLISAFSADIKYNAIRYLTHLPENLEFSEIRDSSPDDIGNRIRNGIYHGTVLCAPPRSIIPSVTEACRDAGIPLGIFAGMAVDGGDVFSAFNMDHDFLEVFKQLIQRKRRRLLVVSLPQRRENDILRKTVEDVSGSFEKAVFREDTIAETTNYLLQNTGGSGENFDCVVYSANIFETYEKLQAQAPDCLCVMSNFAVWREKNFRGLMMNYDLETAGIQFGKAMAALLNKQIPENPKGFIPCSIQEIS